MEGPTTVTEEPQSSAPPGLLGTESRNYWGIKAKRKRTPKGPGLGVEEGPG